MSTRIIYLRATSYRAIKALTDWRDTVDACHKVWKAYADKIGARTYLQIAVWERPTCFSFHYGKQPEGWTKTRGRHDVSMPKKTNKEAQAEIAALPEAISSDALAAQFGLPTAYTYTNGWSRIGTFWNTWQVGWTDQDLFLSGQDIREIVKEHPDDPNFKFVDSTGEYPLEDFELLTEAQAELLYAQAAVRREQEEA